MAGSLKRFFILLVFLFPLALPAGGRAAARVTLTDMFGRRVRVPARVETVVPLGGALRFMVYLRALDQVAGMERIERKWRSPGRLYGLVTAKLAGRLPVVGEGGPGRLPDFERIVAVWPDVIVAMGLDREAVELIQERTGRPVFALDYGSAGSLDLGRAEEALRLLGRLLGRGDRAREVVAYIEAQVARLASLTGRDAGQRPRAYLGAISYKGTQGITSTEPFQAPLAWAGGRNVADAVGKHGHLFVDREKILAWDPETVFIDAGSLDVVRDDYRRHPGFYRKLRAVAAGRVFLTMPYNYYHTNLEIALADAWFMARCLHPGVLGDMDPAARADAIFSFFIGRPAYAALKSRFAGFGRLDFREGEIVVR
jgi:iron complex transport system substrate-binding protein